MKISAKFALIALVLAGLAGCKNQDVDFPDFTYTSVYFPVQYPVRTLSLSENDRIDNTADRNLSFDIGVSIGGMRKNTKNWTVNVEYDAALAANLKASTGETIKPLPQEYISSITPGMPGTVTIPSGKFDGLITVNLNSSFLNDTSAFKNTYVVPLKITGSSADSILFGLPAVPNPKLHQADNWDALAKPRFFTLFGVKFVNEYHGKYLQRGVDISKNASGVETARQVYRKKFITQDQVVQLKTSGRTKVNANFTGITVSPAFAVGMTLDVDGSGNVTISPLAGAKFPVTGSGKFVKAAQSTEFWGEANREVLHLNYSYVDKDITHEVRDTIVFRDRGLAWEELKPVYIQ